MMAIQERMYQRVSFKQTLKCIRWCQNKLNLRDWEIDVKETTIEIEGDECFGAAIVKSGGWTMKADLKIDFALHKTEGVSPYTTICHEMIHILTIGKCHIDRDNTPCEEFIPRVFEDLLYVDYCRFAKIKIMPLKGK